MTAEQRMNGDFSKLTVYEAAQRIADGRISALELTEACLSQIEAREEEVGAWTWLDPDYARAQAGEADDVRAKGYGIGPLHGVPIGIKDILDTADMPTENGTVVHKGRQPDADAVAVSALRDAGAIILGKTVTTELAVFGPGKTRNPHHSGHTPGGSSSGSAAAVASYMVPAAIGTQTAGSVIRPASFCGIFGFKPTHGYIARVGCLNQSPPLDTIGLFARSIEDLAYVGQCLTASDARDQGSWRRSRAPFHRIAMKDVPVVPQFGFVKTPKWELGEREMQEGLSELVEVLGERCDEVPLPDIFEKAWDWQSVLQHRDIARNFGPLFEGAPEKATPRLREMMGVGAKIDDTQYDTALHMQDVINAGLDEIFERYDAILTPAAAGHAPHGLESTGDPVFNSLWTYAGVPCLTLPLLEVNGLPVGVQLVGPRRDDGRLLRTGRWLQNFVKETA